MVLTHPQRKVSLTNLLACPTTTGVAGQGSGLTVASPVPEVGGRGFEPRIAGPKPAVLAAYTIPQRDAAAPF
jgi:hypothetical protein